MLSEPAVTRPWARPVAKKEQMNLADLPELSDTLGIKMGSEVVDAINSDVRRETTCTTREMEHASQQLQDTTDQEEARAGHENPSGS